MTMHRWIRFWINETPIRLRSWWRRHWWPTRLRQVERERRYWQDAATTSEDEVARLAQFIINDVPGEPSQSQGAVDTAIRLLKAQG